MIFDLLILIPCYNEYNRLKSNAFVSFAKSNASCAILFCNDGSNDQTLEKLKLIQAECPNNIFIFDSRDNLGKAEIIRAGILYATSNKLNSRKIAYLDADLSSSLQECREISLKVEDSIILAFGSRISKIDNEIRRKPYRHYLGRIIATFISNSLGIAVYDTQCGCKIFSRKTADVLFAEKFISRWLFDVEIFFRLIKIYGKENLKNVCREVPLKNWVDEAESKVSFSYGFRLWYDLFLINRKYR